MKMIRCPACNASASGGLCSTCNGQRLVPADGGQYDWADFTETDEDFKRVRKDQRSVRIR